MLQKEMVDNRYRSASSVLQDVVDKNTADTLTFHDIKLSLHERGFGLLMLIFSLPIVLVPPGLTAIACVPVLLFSAQMLFASPAPWMPKWLGQKSIKRTTLANIILKASPYLSKIERLLKPRLYFASSKRGEQIIGLFGVFFSLSIAVPLPFTNMIPAIAIAIMSLGLLSKDGLVIILGMIIGALGTTFTLLILLLGKKVVFEVIHGVAALFGLHP